jgi:hypothetical protein
MITIIPAFALSNIKARVTTTLTTEVLDVVASEAVEAIETVVEVDTTLVVTNSEIPTNQPSHKAVKNQQQLSKTMLMLRLKLTMLSRIIVIIATIRTTGTMVVTISAITVARVAASVIIITVAIISSLRI